MLAMRHVGAQQDVVARLDRVVAEDFVSLHAAGEHPRGRIEPHGLAHHHAGVDQARRVLGGRIAVAEDLGRLGDEARRHVLVL